MSPATKTPAKGKPAAKSTKTPAKAPAKRTPRKVTAAAKTAEKPGVDKSTATETAKATKQSVAKGRKSSDVLTMTVPKGAPTNRDEWDAMVTLAKTEHEAYLKWRRDGQPGGAKSEPKRPTLDALQTLKSNGVTRASLPEVVKPKSTGKGGARHTGTIPEGKTAAGLDRLDDAATVKWIKSTDKSGDMTVGALHRQFREAGYGANAKRFARLVEQARTGK